MSDFNEEECFNAVEETLADFVEKAGRCDSEDEIQSHAEAMVVIGIAVLRGTGGAEFTKAFLHSAINEKSPMVITPQKIKQH